MIHWTPLGYHPENEKDLTPAWIARSYLIALVVVVALFITGRVINGQLYSNLFSGLFLLLFGANLLNRVVLNRRQGVRYFDLVFSIFLMGSGLYAFLKP